MINNYYLRNLLYKEEVESIKNLLLECKESDWVDGLESLPEGNHTIKKVKQLHHEVSTDIHNIILNSIDDRDQKFLDFTVAKGSSFPLITKMNGGDFYHTHHDNGVNGHFSTTVFISNPEDYEGGELCLTIDGVESKVKLNAGQAITYGTGIPHRVNTIKSGERIAIIFWTQSRIPDPWAREIYKDLSNAYYCFQSKEYDKAEFLTEGVRHSVLRRYL